MESVSADFDIPLYRKYFPTACNDPYKEWLSMPSGVSSGAKNIIVSLTSHPKRINTTWLAIESIMRQTYKPTKIVLTLITGDFQRQIQLGSDLVKSLPKSLRQLRKRGLEINFENTNWYVASKLVPVLKDNPKATIITCDDDRIYSSNWLETLIETHKKYPKCIVCPHVRRYCLRNQSVQSVPSLQSVPSIHLAPSANNPNQRCNDLSAHTTPKNIMSNLLTHVVDVIDKIHDLVDSSSSDSSQYPTMKTCHQLPIDYLRQDPVYDEPIFGIFEGFAGVLYPPKSLYGDVFDRELFLTYTPVADDIWFQVMAMRAGTKCVSPPKLTNGALQISFEEIDGTQTYGLYKQHLMANDVMLYECLRAFDLGTMVGLPHNLPHAVCSYCNRLIKSKLVMNRSSSPDCRGCLSREQRIILCIGAYDYGNIGDNIYKAVLRHDLTEANYKVIACPDTVYIDNHGNYSLDNLNIADYDILVVGGGGILRNYSTNSTSTITFYMKHAISQSKPMFMISVGFQDEYIGKLDAETINLLSYAQFITVRSTEDYKHLHTAAPTYVVRDLGYNYANILQHAPCQKRYITLIPAGTCNISQQYVREKINTQLRKYPGSRLLVMHWGGIEDPNHKPDNTLMQLTLEYYPHATVLHGDSLSDGIVSRIYNGHSHHKSDLNPEKAVGLVRESYHVFTGRYHGLVVARSLGIPVEALIYNHKCQSELAMPEMTQYSQPPNHISMIVEYIKHSGWTYDWRNWDDDTRNTMIVNLHNEIGVDIPFVQAMNNQTIWEYLTGLKKL